MMFALSAAAYVPSPNACIQRWMPSPKSWRLYSSVSEICDSVNNTCRAYTIVSEKHRQMVIVFRGTNSNEQLFAEGWQSLQPASDFYGFGTVNNYFAAALNTLWPSVEAALKDSKHKDYNVTFTGHSLGGALASLASIKATLEGLRKNGQLKLYTFGQPRVGCPKFAAKHDELIPNSFRVVFRSDVVPHLPPCAKNKQWAVLDSLTSKPCDPSAEGNAYHHGIEIWYPVGMKSEGGDYFIECTGIPRGEDFRCSNLLSFELAKYDQFISDHRHYFDHKVFSFASLDCDPGKKMLEEKLAEEGTEKKKAGFFESFVKNVQLFGKVIGLW